MVWMPLSNKKNARRRLSSPSSSSDSSSKLTNRKFFGSKNKRRILRKRDCSATEASSLGSRSSLHVDSAPWRVENIRQCPPTNDDWWEEAEAGTPDSIDVYQEVEDGNNNNNLLPAVAINAQVSKGGKRFHNCGLATWQVSRQAWKIKTQLAAYKKPVLLDRAQTVKGLKKATSQRTYELPRRMALSDLIRVYNDIWDGDD